MKKIGFIGAGNMATAIIKGLMAQNDGKADFINVFDVSEEKCAAMKNMGANVMTLQRTAQLLFLQSSRRIIPKFLSPSKTALQQPKP